MRNRCRYGIGAPPRHRSLPPPRPAALKAPLAASEHYGPAPLVFGANQDRLRETAPGISEQRILSHSSLRSEEHTSELQSLMRTTYAVFCLNKQKSNHKHTHTSHTSPSNQ